MLNIFKLHIKFNILLFQPSCSIEGDAWVFQTGASEVEEDMLAIALYDLEISVLNVCP